MHLRLERKYPDRFLIRRYEDILKSPLESSQELFDRLCLEMTKQTQNFIAASQNRHDSHRRSVYKDPSKLDDWKTSMDQDVATKIYYELERTNLAVFLDD